jgi:hypothetical protein
VEQTERIRRPPQTVGTLGRGRIFVQKADDPPAVEAHPPPPQPEEPKRQGRIGLALAGVVVIAAAGAGAFVFRDRLAPKPPPPPPAKPPPPSPERPIAEIPPGAVFFDVGPFDEQGLGRALFAPDGRRFAFLYLEGGARGFEGAGRTKTPNNLMFNGRVVHIGSAPEAEAGRQRLGYFERTDRFWYLARVGEQEKLVLEDDESEAFDRIGEPTEAPDGKEVAYWGQRGAQFMAVVGPWMSAPYARPIIGPYFSAGGESFAYLVGTAGDRSIEAREVVGCVRATKACKKRPVNPARSIEEILGTAEPEQLYFALDWYASKADEHVSLEDVLVTRAGDRFTYAPITRLTASLESVALGHRTEDLHRIARESKLEKPIIERVEVTADGGAIAMIASSREYVAGDGVVIRRSPAGEVKVKKEYVRCKYSVPPFAKREWLVLSADGSKLAYCSNTPTHGERIVVNEHALAPKAYVMSPPVFSPDASSVAYFAVDERRWWAIVDHTKHGPYDELFERPRFSPDGKTVWFGARRDRTVLFVRVPVEPIAQPEDEATP